jgi:hypothetical protein
MISAQKNNTDCALTYRQRNLNPLVHAWGKFKQDLPLRKILRRFSGILYSGAVQGSQGRQCLLDNVAPHRSAVTELVSNFTNSDMSAAALQPEHQSMWPLSIQ